MSQESNLLAATQRLRARLRAAEARNDELEELLARALAVSEALDAMLGHFLGGGDGAEHA
jgi:hypothetical protein